MGNEKVILLGAGNMGKAYAKVLNALGVSYDVFTRSKETAASFESETGKKAIYGDLVNFLDNQGEKYNKAINSYKAQALKDSSITLLDYGIKKILCEKPGGFDALELEMIEEKRKSKSAEVYIAYNRRFYSSIIEAKKIIKEDGGLRSIIFEFTEWLHVFHIQKLNKTIIKELFVGNSSHVIDTAFYLSGRPKDYIFYSDFGFDEAQGIFCGSGITDKNVFFSYGSNWNSPGRWSIELLTENYRLYLKPFERLAIQKKKSIIIDELDIDYRLDEEYKPGVYRETLKFLNGVGEDNLKTLSEQVADIKIYEEMFNGNPK